MPPPNWNRITSPVRGCGRSSTNAACNSATFPSNDLSYSHVCGRMVAYQQGSPDAFHPSITSTTTIESVYVDGVSLTHGAAGSRQHIWTFAAAIYETHSPFTPDWVCPCTNINQPWPFQVPTFVGDSYFCASGNPGPGWVNGQVYPDNPLFDGEGCRTTNACCQFNSPPWFSTTLQQSTSDNLELCICSDQDLQEDVIINLVEIYVK